MKTNTVQAVRQLDTIIGKLEAWQNRYKIDEAGYSDQAKSLLFRLLKRLETQRTN